MKTDLVSIASCRDYQRQTCRAALKTLLEPLGGLEWVRPGMRIAIKANLVAAAKPDRAVTTHPQLLIALSEMLMERGASVTIGDSPGNLYNAAVLNHIYAVSGLTEAETIGVTLNRDFSEKQAYNDQAVQAKSFVYTRYLDDADAVINFCKLKSHGMMGLSAAAKNLFGTIPGTMKPEYHYRFPNPNDFADMIVDLDEFFKPVLHICDAVVAMEGNGPTQGTPHSLGCLLASKDPHCLDVLAAALIGYDPYEIPTIAAAKRRGLAPERFEDLAIAGDWRSFIPDSFELIHNRNSLLFVNADSGVGKLARRVMHACLESRPQVRRSLCIGCRKCANICPAHTIEIRDGKAVIHRKNCIKCFCCQEFCPKGAMRVHRTLIARLLNK